MSTISDTPQPIIVGHVARPLLGKTALVTGGSRGIGAAIARAFAAAGADVAISFLASPGKAEDVVKDIEATGQRGFAIKADHANQSDVTALVQQAVKSLGKLDILVNNAGIVTYGSSIDPASSSDISIENVTRLFAINVSAVATAVRSAAPYLPSGGRIINIGSALAQQVPVTGMADYAASKSALVAYTKGWARDFGSRGVTVNLIQPGHIDTDLNSASGPFGNASKRAPVGRHGRPEELAAAVLFLATPAASYVSAAILNVDGGITA